MTLKDKELLIKDICGRLPYGVYVEHTESGVMGKLCDIEVFQTYNEDDTVKDYLCYTNFFGDEACKIEYFKPYLFPLSSMTEEQKKELIAYAGYERREEDVGYHSETYYYDLVGHENILYPNADAIDWLNKNHFDYRDLIPKGLAIDATGLNIF